MPRRTGHQGDRIGQSYERGFTDGGGNLTDLFDAARRINFACSGKGMPFPMPLCAGRPLPYHWQAPSDRPAPAPWPQRLVIVEPEAANMVLAGGQTALDTVRAYARAAGWWRTRWAKAPARRWRRTADLAAARAPS
ncbi:hypothetical protein [Sphingobium baderi]|uniref:hypothetical protein n=1 Tax=Sphingobium baderi TaxID=1332080 RepID=UPI002B4170B4|nr:hypothetical protein [Sphingobium baderi]WRD78762.1 hypothetical protein QQ987_20475 [Sphingobium baderi]